MRDFRKELEDGGCRENHGCNAASVCLCGIIEDAADEIDRLRAALIDIRNDSARHRVLHIVAEALEQNETGSA